MKPSLSERMLTAWRPRPVPAEAPAPEAPAPLVEAVLRERTEMRAAHPSSEAEIMAIMLGYKNPLAVSEYDALTNPAIWNAIDSISKTFAMLPGAVYRRDADGNKEAVQDHPLNRIMKRRWNPIQTAFEGKQTFAANFLLRGGGYAEIIRDRGQRLRELWLVPSNKVSMHQVGRALRFDIQQDDGTTASRPHESMLWMNGLHLEGFQGIDPMWVHQRTIGTSLALDNYMRTFFLSGGNLRQALKYPRKLEDDDVKRIRRRWIDLYGNPESPHDVAILEGGVEPTTIGVAPNAAQMTETELNCVRNAARMFNSPPSRVGDHSNSTMNNIEHQGIEFVTYTMMPITVCWEAAVNAQCFTEREQDAGLFWENNLEVLLRGDTQSRYTAYGMAIRDGWMARNEVRKRENMNARPGLDDFIIPANMTNIDTPPQD